MKYSIFPALSLLIIVQATPQLNTPEQNLAPPEQPISSNNTRIVYPSEDTNKNRAPSHVSSEVRCISSFNWLRLSSVISKNLFANELV